MAKSPSSMVQGVRLVRSTLRVSKLRALELTEKGQRIVLDDYSRFVFFLRLSANIWPSFKRSRSNFRDIVNFSNSQVYISKNINFSENKSSPACLTFESE